MKAAIYPYLAVYNLYCSQFYVVASVLLYFHIDLFCVSQLSALGLVLAGQAGGGRTGYCTLIY